MSLVNAVSRSAQPRITGKTLMADLPRPLVQRATQARRQNAREKARQRKKVESAAKWDRIQMQTRINQVHLTNEKNERVWRREDRVLGALAPKRNVGALEQTFGSMPVETYHAPETPLKSRREYGIVNGDRVVVTKRGHKDFGKIGKVRDVRERSEQAIVEGLNLTDLAIPEYMLIREQDKTLVRAYEFPFHLSDLRLVAPLPDPSNEGRVRDVVIKELKLERITARERKGLDPPTRTVAGLFPPMIIPYPRKPEPWEEESGAKDHAVDTLRIEVEARSWTPTMESPPMPPMVIDELRNKFGKFRIRHEPTYVERVRAAEENRVENQRQRRLLMMTPIKQRNRAERLERKAQGTPELSDEQLAAIGQVMERNLGLRMEAAGMEKLVEEKADQS